MRLALASGIAELPHKAQTLPETTSCAVQNTKSLSPRRMAAQARELHATFPTAEGVGFIQQFLRPVGVNCVEGYDYGFGCPACSPFLQKFDHASLRNRR